MSPKPPRIPSKRKGGASAGRSRDASNAPVAKAASGRASCANFAASPPATHHCNTAICAAVAMAAQHTLSSAARSGVSARSRARASWSSAASASSCARTATSACASSSSSSSSFCRAPYIAARSTGAGGIGGTYVRRFLAIPSATTRDVLIYRLPCCCLASI